MILLLAASGKANHAALEQTMNVTCDLFDRSWRTWAGATV